VVTDLLPLSEYKYKNKMSEYKHPFKDIAIKFRKLKEQLPILVSNMAMNDFKQNFRRQGFINRNGVLIPWKSTKKKQNKFGKKSSGILIGSGRLKRSIRPAPRTNEARVISDVPYAEAHNEGFKQTVNVKAHYRNKYKKTKIGTGKYTKKGKERMQTVMNIDNTFAVGNHNRKMNIPRRPFMITSKTLLDEIDKMLDKKLDNIF